MFHLITRVSCSLAVLFCLGAVAGAGDDSHWSRQFPKPSSSTRMTGETGMSDGNGKPTVNMARWHEGKLYMGGAWDAGVDGRDLSKRDANVRWYLWSWHPQEGYRPIAWRHSAQGGPGPNGVVNDFCFLPDGRLAVAGEFLGIGNPHGHSYHRVKGLAVYNPKEPTGTRWQPLVKSVQHNGPGGNVQTIAYDPKAKELWVGGSFSGFRMDPTHLEQFCFGVQRYSFTKKQWQIMVPGVRGGTGVRRIKIDTSTTPSTIYMAGRFSHTGGDGKSARDGGTNRYTEGFCAWRDDAGWITFPKKHVDGKIHTQGVLQRAADFTHFDSVNVLDFLVDGKDIWIVGAFSGGTIGDGKPLRGIAKWDDAKQAWVDPTGKGGFGREPYAIAKTADGKIYVAGAFGGEGKGKGKHYDGFKNGDDAFMCASFDPETGAWSTLGSGLGGYSMPVCRVTTNGNDVFFYGTFRCIGRDAKKKELQSYYLARWNEYVDFTKETPDLPGSDNPQHLVEPATDAPAVTAGLEHWSRRFPPPPRQKSGKTQQSALTGMDPGTGTPDIKCLQWHEGTLYIGGSWEVQMNERWFVWTYSPKDGWAPLARQMKGGKKEGFATIPAGLKWHGEKMYVYGASEDWKGIAVYDPAAKSWSKFTGTYQGKPIVGNGAQGNPAINDVAWDSRTGDMYLVGACGEAIRYEQGHRGGTVPSQVLRVGKDGVYHPMGLMLLAQNPSKPEIGVYCILLDETKTPTDLYIGGCFGFKGANSNRRNAVYNVARWDHEAGDWGPIGKGDFWRIGMHDAKTFPEGQPGLKGQPVYGFPTFLRELWPRVRCLAMDGKGNLYAGGAVGILDDNPDVTKRDEQYGIVKYDRAGNEWVGAATCRGVSRDVFQMTWLDEKRLLLSGGFLYSEDFRLLNNVAILDTTSGALSPLAGGLHKAHDGHVISSNVVHTVADDGYWFGGFFHYAGVGPKSRSQAPIPSSFIAHYNPKENLDPNGAMTISAPKSIPGVKGYSSQSRDVQLEAKDIPEGGKVTWYQLSRGKLKKIGQGPACKAKVRVSGKDRSFTFSAAVTTAEGIEGGKIPVVIPVLAP